MKKLLSLLSVLTISGTAVPTTIAASPYQKEERLNSEINYSQINNLKKLNREKRENKKILWLDRFNKKLIINATNIKDYFSSSNIILDFLINQGILNSIFETETENGGRIFEISQDCPESFVLPLNINDNENILLVFRTRDLYLQGFISQHQINLADGPNWVLDDYYYFRDSSVNSIENVRENVVLPFESSYTSSNGLNINENIEITWTSIVSAFDGLINYAQNASRGNIRILRASLFRVVLATSEALRFRAIHDLISSNLQTYSGRLFWNPDSYSGQTNIRNIVTNWQSTSNNIIDAINNIQARFGNNNRSITEWFYNLLSQLPTNTIAQALENTDVRVILGLLMRPALNCDRRRARSINNNIKNEYCYTIKDQNEGYNLGNREITVVKILNENTKGGTLQSGDIYIGTTSGVYLWFKRGNEINLKKFDGLDYRINDIILDGNGSANVKANGLIYHLDLYGWGHTIVRDELK